MSETSPHVVKLVSQPEHGRFARRSYSQASALGLSALAERAQATRADLHPDRPVTLSDRHPLQVHLPTALGVALRKANAITRQWPCSATECTFVGHLYPLTIAGWSAGSKQKHRRTVDFTMSSGFVQTGPATR